MSAVKVTQTGLRMAKATKEEQDQVIRFAAELHDNASVLRSNMDDEDLGAWVRKNLPPLMRVAFGYQVLVDNCCDPEKSALEFKPEIIAGKEALKIQPELYAMAKELRDAAINTPDLDDSKDWSALIDRADVVLAKAKGTK